MNIVWDLAGVLLHWRPAEMLARVLPHVASTPQAAQALFETFFEGYGGDWHRFDCGVVDAPALAERIARRTGLALRDTRAVIDAVPHELQPLHDSVALLDDLHAAGHRQFFLSNMPAPYADHLERAHRLFERFADGVFSARVQCAKPDPHIFELARQRFGIAAADLLFIDDHAPNIDAARALAWPALQFVSAAQVRTDLQQRALVQA